MTTKDEIISYVKHTPENTNPAVLKSMLDELDGGSSSGFPTVSIPIWLVSYIIEAYDYKIENKTKITTINAPAGSKVNIDLSLYSLSADEEQYDCLPVYGTEIDGILSDPNTSPFVPKPIYIKNTENSMVSSIDTLAFDLSEWLAVTNNANAIAIVYAPVPR